MGRKRKPAVLVDLRLDGRLRLEKINGSPNIRARAWLQGKYHTKSTGESDKNAAVRIAEKWYFGLREQMARGEHISVKTLPKSGVLFADAYESFIAHADRVEEAGPLQRRNYRHKWSVLKKYFDGVTLPQIDITWLENLRKQRKASTQTHDAKGRPHARMKPISNVTIKKDMNFVRLVMRHAVERDKVLARLPHFPSFRGTKWKAKHKMRPYLSPEMWRKVKKAALKRIDEPASINRLTAARAKLQRQELYCFLMICVGGALRVEEANGLTWGDCELGTLNGTECVRVWLSASKKRETEDERLRGWLLYDGVRGFKHLRKLYPNAKPDEKLFKEKHTDGMTSLLEACGVKKDDVTGMTRDNKSLRSTGLSLRLDEGPDPAYNDLSQWARTSPQQLMNFYIQLHPDKAVGRIIGFRGDEQEDPKRGRKSQKLRELPSSETLLNRHRKQIRLDEMKDNDDIYGVSDDDEQIEAPVSETSRASLRIVSKKKR